MRITLFILLISCSIARAQKVDEMPGAAVSGDLHFDSEDFLKGYSVKEETLVWQQVISKYFPRLGGSVAFKTKNQYSLGILGNAPVVDMFRIILGKDSNRYYSMNRVPFGLVQLRVKDLSKYIFKIGGEFQYSNLSTFQLITTRPTSSLRVRNLMIDEIKEYFGLEMTWERQRRKCLVLGAMDSTLTPYKGEPVVFLGLDSIHFTGVTVRELVSYFVETTDYHYSPYPIVDETDFKGQLKGIHLAAELNDYRELDKALHRYGLYLRLEERSVDVLVLKRERIRRSTATLGQRVEHYYKIANRQR